MSLIFRLSHAGTKQSLQLSTNLIALKTLLGSGTLFEIQTSPGNTAARPMTTRMPIAGGMIVTMPMSL